MTIKRTCKRKRVCAFFISIVIVAAVDLAFGQSPLQKDARSKMGMVASSFPEAAWGGERMLAAGGNAIDAAVATAFGLSVCESWASGLGGQTYLLVHLRNGRNVAIDGSSIAPQRYDLQELTQGNNRSLGYKSATVPSTVATLAHALEADMIRNGGYIRKDDLAAVKIVEREPVMGKHRGLEAENLHRSCRSEEGWNSTRSGQRARFSRIQSDAQSELRVEA